MGNQRRDPGAFTTSTRLIIISAALGLMLAVGLDLAARLQTPGYRAASAIQAGYAHAAGPDADAAADEALTGSANEAGFRWAERRALDRPGPCDQLTAAFRAGCLAYVHDQSR
jgi:hypothetical protein